jgi:hypothetical protein
MRSNASTCAADAFGDFVKMVIPSAIVVAQARTRRPLSSTMHVSHV